MESRCSNPAARLRPNDFRRLGVRPHEFRLAVIRRAAMLRARGLAVQQLRSPTAKFERKLTRLATSTYRLLDPRLRHDQHHRLLVGRIHPQILHGAGQTCFHSELLNFGSSPRQLVNTPFERSLLTDAELIELLDIDSPPRGTRPDLPQWAVRLSDADLLESQSLSRRLKRLRTRIGRSPRILAVAGMLLLALLGVAFDRWRSGPRTMIPSSVAQTIPRSPAPSRSDHAHSDHSGADQLRTVPQTNSPHSQSSSELSQSASIAAQLDSSQRLRPAQPSIVIPSQQPLASDRADTSRQAANESSSILKPTLESVGPEAHERSAVSGEIAKANTVVDQDLAISEDSRSIDTQERSMMLAENQSQEGSQDLQNVTESSLDVLDAEKRSQASSQDAWAAIDSIGSLPNSFAPIAKPVPLIDLDFEIASKPLKLESVRRAIPDEASLRLARRGLIDLMPTLEYAYEATQAPIRIEQLEWIQRQFAIGSTENWIITHLIAETAWLIESVPDVEQRLRELALHYQVSSERLLAETFVNALPHASVPATRSHLLQNGLRLAERLLQQSEAEPCGDVVQAMEPAVSDPSPTNDAVRRHLQEYSESLEFIKQHASLIDRIGRQDSVPEQHEAIILGQHYCLILRQWERGIHWLRHTSDSRVDHATEEELALGDQPTAEQLHGVARDWLIAANRTSGRSADAMRLHAIDLLHRGQAKASGSERVEMDRQLEETLRSIPPHLVPVDQRSQTPAAGSRSKGPRRPFPEPLF